MLDVLLVIVLVVLVLVLGAGVISMVRGGEASGKWSNLLMRYRVAVQFVALGLILLILYLR